MKKFLKLMVALLVVSVIGFGVAFAMSGFEIDNFPEVFYASADEDFTEKSQTLSLDGINGLFVLGRSERIVLNNTDSDELSIKYFDSDYKTTEIKSENGKISVESIISIRTFAYYFKVQTGKTDYIEVNLPKGFEGDLDLATSSSNVTVNATNSFASVRLATTSGRIEASNLTSRGSSEFLTSSDMIKISNCDLSAGDTSIKTSSGDIKINNSFFANATVKTSSDSITINSSTFDGDLDAKTNSGDIKLVNVEANNLTAQTNSDDVLLSSVRANDVVVKTSSGRIDVKDGVFGKADFKSSSAGIYLDIECENITAKTSSGKIIMTVKGRFDDYKMDVKTSSASITVDGTKYYSMIINPSAEKYIYAHTSSDRINISFTD